MEVKGVKSVWGRGWKRNRGIIEYSKDFPLYRLFKVDTYKSYPLSTLLKRPYKKWVVCI